MLNCTTCFVLHTYILAARADTKWWACLLTNAMCYTDLYALSHHQMSAASILQPVSKWPIICSQVACLLLMAFAETSRHVQTAAGSAIEHAAAYHWLDCLCLSDRVECLPSVPGVPTGPAYLASRPGLGSTMNASMMMTSMLGGRASTPSTMNMPHPLGAPPQHQHWVFLAPPGGGSAGGIAASISQRLCAGAGCWEGTAAAGDRDADCSTARICWAAEHTGAWLKLCHMLVASVCFRATGDERCLNGCCPCAHVIA